MNNNYNSKSFAICGILKIDAFFICIHKNSFKCISLPSFLRKVMAFTRGRFGVYGNSLNQIDLLSGVGSFFFRATHIHTPFNVLFPRHVQPFFLLLITSIYHHFYSHDSCNNNSFGIINNVLRTLRLSTCEYTKFFVDIWTIWCILHMQFAFNGCVEHQHNHSAPYTSHLLDGNIVTILIHVFIVTEDLESFE